MMESSSTVQACRMAPWPTVTRLPMMVGAGLLPTLFFATWMTVPSCGGRGGVGQGGGRCPRVCFGFILGILGQAAQPAGTEGGAPQAGAQKARRGRAGRRVDRHAEGSRRRVWRVFLHEPGMECSMQPAGEEGQRRVPA